MTFVRRNPLVSFFVLAYGLSSAIGHDRSLSHYGRTESNDCVRPLPNKKTDLRFAKRGLRCARTRHSAEPHAKGESVHG